MKTTQANTKKYTKAKVLKANLSVPARIAQEVRSVADRVVSAVTKQPVDLITAIKQDHDDLRQYIETLKDVKKDMSVRKHAFELFSSLLKSHTKAEENSVYAALEKTAKKDLVIRIKEGFVEHEAAEHVLKKIEKITEAKEWSAHVNVLAELVEHHIKEEEDEMFPLIRRQIKEDTQQDLLVEFISLRGKTQKSIGRTNAGVLKNLQ